MKKILIVFFGLLTLTSCIYSDFPDGTIPQEFKATVSPLLGTYVGTISGRRADFPDLHSRECMIEILLNENKPIVRSSIDLAGEGCGSAIGDLRSAELSESGQLNRAFFAFNPGRCKPHVTGNRVQLVFSKSDGKPMFRLFLTLNQKMVKRSSGYQLKSDELRGNFEKQ